MLSDRLCQVQGVLLLSPWGLELGMEEKNGREG